jgi:hypothetical protein
LEAAVKLSYRILPPIYDSDEQFERLVQLLRAHANAIDEIALFTDYCHHGYTPLGPFAALMQTAARRINTLHDLGFASVGINVLVTRGHLDEAWDFVEMPFSTEIYRDGTRSKSVVCPSSAEYRRYVARRYALIAHAGPDFIWVDDDMRMQQGDRLACFCPACLANFDGGRWSRETLSRELDLPEAAEVRAAWIEHTTSAIDDLLRLVAETVHEIDPEIDLGLMTIPLSDTYIAPAMQRWFATLGGTKGRPGGGFYLDTSPTGMLTKNIAIARQCVAYPPEITDIQYELENFPYQKLGKSKATVLNECALSLASGCNGIAFNIMKDLPGSLEPYEELVAEIEAARPAWEMLSETLPGTIRTGLYVPTRPDQWIQRPRIEADLHRRAPDDPAQILMELGLPVTVDLMGAVGTVLAGDMAAYFDDSALKAILAGGALIDGSTADILFQRGLGSLSGVRIGRSFDNGAFERFSDHPLNGDYAGDARDARISFWSAPADTLEPVAPDVQPLAYLIGYDRSDLGMCATAFTNTLGGRVVTFGYAPWTYLFSSAKRTQMVNAADWIAGNRLPALIPNVVRVTPVVRATKDRSKVAAVLLNTSFDESGELDVIFRTTGTSARLLTPAGSTILASRRTGADLIVTVPSLAPWRHALIAV